MSRFNKMRCTGCKFMCHCQKMMLSMKRNTLNTILLSFCKFFNQCFLFKSLLFAVSIASANPSALLSFVIPRLPERSVGLTITGYSKVIPFRSSIESAKMLLEKDLHFLKCHAHQMFVCRNFCTFLGVSH